jgi:hypothetical protein
MRNNASWAGWRKHGRPSALATRHRGTKNHAMNGSNGHGNRNDVVAAIRGGDTEQGMENEHRIGTSSHSQAVFWHDTYQELLTMEEAVMSRIRELMTTQSEAARREVELSNVPVIAAQINRFRARLGYWEARLRELTAESS